MRSTASALQPAISAIENSFELIRRREVERHHHRFAGIDRHELDRITRAITQKLLAVPLARLESIDPAGADLVPGIGHLRTLFSRPACDDELAAGAVEPDDGAEIHAQVPDRASCIQPETEHQVA